MGDNPLTNSKNCLTSSKERHARETMTLPSRRWRFVWGNKFSWNKSVTKVLATKTSHIHFFMVSICLTRHKISTIVQGRQSEKSLMGKLKCPVTVKIPKWQYPIRQKKTPSTWMIGKHYIQNQNYNTFIQTKESKNIMFSYVKSSNKKRNNHHPLIQSCDQPSTLFFIYIFQYNSFISHTNKIHLN